MQAYSWLLLRYTRLHTCRLKKQIQELNVRRLHVGCGHILLPAWLNITLEKREEYGRIIEKNGTLYLNYNLLTDWPINENAVEFIAASHFIQCQGKLAYFVFRSLRYPVAEISIRISPGKLDHPVDGLYDVAGDYRT